MARSKKPTAEDLKHIHPSLHGLAVPIEPFIRHPDNPRVHNRRNLEAIGGSLRRYQQRKNVVANRTPAGYRLEAGHGVYERMLEAGSQWIAAALMDDDTKTELGYMLADNRTGDLSEDDPAKDAAILRLLLDAGEDVEEVGWEDEEVQKLLAAQGQGEGEGQDDDATKTSLCERFLVPPFSVLDARQGYWQERKRAWLALGIQSELGRGGAARPDDERHDTTVEALSRSGSETHSGSGGGQVRAAVPDQR